MAERQCREDEHQQVRDVERKVHRHGEREVRHHGGREVQEASAQVRPRVRRHLRSPEWTARIVAGRSRDRGQCRGFAHMPPAIWAYTEEGR
jgi:hypothetical protein